MKKSIAEAYSWLAIFIAIALTGCAAQLAPQYDQAILDGLISMNKNAQTFFASLGTGVSKDTYPKRADTYAKLIGSLNALEIQVKSRPIPPRADLASFNALLSKNGVPAIPNDPKFTNYPSARAINDASKSLQQMQMMDQDTGLRGFQLTSIKNDATIYLTQAITYETFLKR